MEVKRITLNMSPKEAELLMQKMNDDINALNAENGRLRAVLRKCLDAFESPQGQLIGAQHSALVREALANHEKLKGAKP